jgi:hypothetical protein
LSLASLSVSELVSQTDTFFLFLPALRSERGVVSISFESTLSNRAFLPELYFKTGVPINDVVESGLTGNLYNFPSNTNKPLSTALVKVDLSNEVKSHPSFLSSIE